MRITIGTLFMTLAVFLDSIELSSQLFTSLKELFPEFSGNFLPNLKTFQYENNQQLRNLRKIDGEHFTAFNESSTLAKRHPIIIGWMADDRIKPIFPPGGNYRTCYVFNTDGNHFLEMSPVDHRKLGVNQLISDVLGADHIMSVRLESLLAMKQRNKAAEEYAEKEAAKEADIQASFESHVQARKPNQSQEARALAIRQAYHRRYNQVYPEAVGQYLQRNRPRKYNK